VIMLKVRPHVFAFISGCKTLSTSPRITHSDGVEVNGSWTTHSKGTLFH
jgi:hypothetical protein